MKTKQQTPQPPKAKHIGDKLKLDNAEPRIILSDIDAINIAECNTIRGAVADEANAAELVKRWNLFPELVEAMKKVIMYAKPEEMDKVRDYSLLRAIEQADALIKKAKGEGQ